MLGHGKGERGVALLAVLWLSVALTFMAMATAHLVRTEVEAVSNHMDWEREYYLARGGIDAAIYSIGHYDGAPLQTDTVSPSQFVSGKRWLTYEFPSGSAVVEVMPEAAKVNVNQALPEQLAGLFSALGESATDTVSLVSAIVEWRSPRTSEVPTVIDEYYTTLPQPYAARHALLDSVEQLLPVRGMSRDLFFGRFERDTAGKWRRWPALSDLLTADSTVGAINPNYASFEVLRSLPGWTDSMAADVIAARQIAPFRNAQELQAAVPAMAGFAGLAGLAFSEGTVFTLTATGILSGSGVRRSVRALVVIEPRLPLGHKIIGWWNDWPAPEFGNRESGIGTPIPNPESRFRARAES